MIKTNTSVYLMVSVCAMFLLLSCRKKEYPPAFQMSGAPIVYLNATIDNQPMKLASGEDGIVCKASVKQGSDSLYLFSGELSSSECVNCNKVFGIELSDIKARMPNESIPVEEVFKSGFRTLLTDINSVFHTRWSAGSNKQVKSVEWQLDNNTTRNDTAFNFSFASGGTHTIALTVNTFNGCQSTIQQKIYIDDAYGLFSAQIRSSAETTNSVRFTPMVRGGKAPYTYLWDFGNGIQSTEESPIYLFKVEGAFPVKLIVKDAANHTCESNYIHVTAKDNSSCTAAITLQTLGTTLIGLKGARLKFTDANQLLYSSASIVQPQDAYFELLDASPYQSNEKGEAARLLTFKFDVLMQSGNKKIRMKSDNATMVVAYK